MQDKSKEESTLARALRGAREERGLSMRELERRAGISQAQVSRIEAGAIDRPAVGTLAAIATALEKDSRLLLVAAGHLRGERAIEALRRVLAERKFAFASSSESGEFAFDWQQAEALLGNEPGDREVAELAVSMFVTSAGMYDVLGAPWLDHLFEGDVPDELQELILSWRDLPSERRRKVLEYAREQRVLVSHEHGELKIQPDERSE